MTHDNLAPRQHVADAARPAAAEGSYVDWPAILAGGVLALALSALLMSFGASLGLSLTSPYRGEGVSASWLAIAAGIWFAWVMVTGFGAGGYLAGRMRRRAGDATPDEVTARDGAHGLLVWATGALLGTVLAAMGAGALVGAGVSAIGSAAGTAAEMADETLAPDYFANVMLRNAAGDPPAQERTEQSAQEGAADTAPSAVAAAPLPRQPAMQGTGVAGIDPAVQQQIAAIIARSVFSGEMIERDRTYLAQLVAANSDLDQAAARTRVDEVNAEIDNARARALAAVERARIAGVIFGFIAAATLLIGAVAAFFAAAAGGRHRDDGLGFDIFAPRR